MPRSGYVLYTNALWFDVKRRYAMADAEATRFHFNHLFDPFLRDLPEYHRARLLRHYARRGRRDPVDLRPGDALDFWRVEAVEPPTLLRLRAEMKVPGRAWLQFEVREDEGQSVLAQTAFFAPKGLAGLLYWYVLYPVHALIFSGLVRGLAARA